MIIKAVIHIVPAEEGGAGVSSSVAAEGNEGPGEGEGAVSSSVAGSNNGAPPLPPSDAAHALATLASAALHHQHEQVPSVYGLS